jgi:hypothetical protein
MVMRKIKPWGLAAVTALAMAGLAPPPAHAGQVFNFNLSGSSIAGNFGTTQTIPCGTGQSTLFTFLSWNAFQAVQRGGGAPTTMLNAGVFLQQNNNCTGEILFDFAFVQSGITLTVNGIKNATLAGQIPLALSGRILTMNLTITSTGNTFQGFNMSRSNIGPMIFISRSNSSSTDASAISGSVALDGQDIPLVNLSDVGGSINNNRTGQLQVIGARTFQ